MPRGTPLDVYRAIKPALSGWLSRVYASSKRIGCKCRFDTLLEALGLVKRTSIPADGHLAARDTVDANEVIDDLLSTHPDAARSGVEINPDGH